MPILRTLLEAELSPASQALPQALLELYDGDLQFPAAPVAAPVDRPYVIANFVSTLDGAASFKLPGQSSGATISGSDPADRFIMGLLRASVDAVMVGVNTIHDTSPAGLWIPPETFPDAKDLYRDYRRNVLRKRDYPLVVVVSGSGKLDLDRAAFQAPDVPMLILTTVAGERELTARGVQRLPAVQVSAIAKTNPETRSTIDPAAILPFLSSRFGVRRLLHEGGPTLFGEFLALGAVDEFFLTLAPEIAGRLPHTIRPGVVQGVEFPPEAAPWFDLLSVKRSAGYLYLRYRRTASRGT